MPLKKFVPLFLGVFVLLATLGAGLWVGGHYRAEHQVPQPILTHIGKEVSEGTTTDDINEIGEIDTGPAANSSCIHEGREDFKCYKAYYADLVGKQGVTSAFVDLKARYASSSAVRAECHQITHVLGRTGAKLAGGVGKAFAQGDPMCWSGYYHGVMEEVLRDVGKEALASKINDICTDIPGKAKYSFGYYNCVHGLGHGVMQLFDGDLFASLKACDLLSGEWEQSSCGGGVFMENIMIESRGGVSQYLKKDDLIYPCNAAPELHKSQCYLMQTSHILEVVKGDFGKVFTACESAEDAYKATCYQSLGRDASGRSVSNADQTKAVCMLGLDQFAQENCVIGAVKDFISFYHSDKEANHFCDILEPSLAATCRSVATSYYSTF